MSFLNGLLFEFQMSDTLFGLSLELDRKLAVVRRIAPEIAPKEFLQERERVDMDLQAYAFMDLFEDRCKELEYWMTVVIPNYDVDRGQWLLYRDLSLAISAAGLRFQRLFGDVAVMRWDLDTWIMLTGSDEPVIL